MPAQQLLDPTVIARLTGLELKARTAVEGLLVGLHKSPYHGFSVEFSQHRQYVPGDSLRYLDYKVLARTGKYYIKQFEAETNLNAHILLDHSGSMGYGSNDVTKLEYGKTLAAALSLLLLRQRDAVGLVPFCEDVTEILPPRSVTGWLQTVTVTLEKLKPSGETKVASALLNVAERVKRKGLVILISDLLDDPDETISAMKAIRHVGHELLVFQLLDPLELSFAFHRDARFQDIETDDILQSRPWHIQAEYQDEINQFIEQFRNRCQQERIDYQLLTTDIPYEIALFEFLSRRKRMG